MPEKGFPEELKEIAGSVCTDGNVIPRNRLVAAVANELYALYEGLADKTYLEDYKRWSNVLGKEVRFTSGEDWEYGTAVDIDEEGGLIIKQRDGQMQTLRTGEITLRLVEKE